MRRFLLVVSLTIMACIHVEASEGPKWQELLDRAESLGAAGHLDSANVVIDEALEAGLTEYDSSDSTVEVRSYRGSVPERVYFRSYAEAEHMYARVALIREEILGGDHIDVAADLTDLANLYRQQGKYDEAERLSRRALPILEETVSPLPGTRKEVELISSNWKESIGEPLFAHFGREASEDVFKSEAPGKRVIHVATHGYYLEGTCEPEQPKIGFESDIGFVGENPLLLSGLFFAGANLHGEVADSLGIDDGILTAYEVSAMDLSGTEMVVLSACETGLGKVEEGEGIYGLRRAFQMAGARTVISALWPVSDEATADMMSHLYEREDESIPETMHRIQMERIRELRKAGLPDHPYTWAGFIAIGDWR
jgi:CHAT domain-containing protein